MYSKYTVHMNISENKDPCELPNVAIDLVDRKDVATDTSIEYSSIISFLLFGYNISDLISNFVLAG